MTSSGLNMLSSLILSQYAFGNDGDKQSISVTPDGNLNNASSTNPTWRFGFPEAFSKALGESGGRLIQREDMNGILYAISNAILYLQRGGVIQFSMDLSNAIGGYPKGAKLWWNGTGVWSIVESLVDNNETEPALTNLGNKWSIVQSFEYDKYLALAGGTMTGPITSGIDGTIIKSDALTKSVDILGGTGPSINSYNGGLLHLTGNNNSTDPNGAVAELGCANSGGNGNNILRLKKSDNSLTYNGKHIVRSVDGVSADANGNVSSVFLSDDITTLAEWPNGIGSFLYVNLSESYKNFWMILVRGSNDSGWHCTAKYIRTQDIVYALETKKKGYTIWDAGGSYWIISSSSTETRWETPNKWENSVLWGIYGLGRKITS